MTRFFVLAAIVSITIGAGARQAIGAEQTWSGTISDNMCGASHAAMSTNGAKVTDRDCTVACVSYQTADSPKFVFVSEGKVYPIVNQRFGGLARHAGQPITLTGEMNNGTITISTITVPEKTK